MPCSNPFDDDSHEYAINTVGLGKYGYIYYGENYFGAPGLRDYTGKTVSGAFGMLGVEEWYDFVTFIGNELQLDWESGLVNGLTRAQNSAIQTHRETYGKTLVTPAMQRELQRKYGPPTNLRYILPQWTIVRILDEDDGLDEDADVVSETYPPDHPEQDPDGESASDDDDPDAPRGRRQGFPSIVVTESVEIVDLSYVNSSSMRAAQTAGFFPAVGNIVGLDVPILFIRCPVLSNNALQIDLQAIAAVKRCIQAHKYRTDLIYQGLSAATGAATVGWLYQNVDELRPWENYWGNGWLSWNYDDADDDIDPNNYTPTFNNMDETRRLEVCGDKADICVQYDTAESCNVHFKPIDVTKPDEINCMWCNNSCRQYDEDYMSNCSNLKNTAEEVFCGKKSGVFGTDLDCDTTDADGCCSSDKNSDSVACTTGFDSNLEHCPIGTTIDGRSYMYYDAKPPDNVGDWRGPGCNVRQCRNCKDFDSLTTIYCGEDSCTAGVTDADKDNLKSNCAGGNDNDLMTCPCGFQHDDFKNYAGKSCDIRKCTKNKFAQNRIYCGKDVCSADESKPSSNAIGDDDTYLIDCPYGYTHKGFQGSFGFNRRVCDKNH